MTVGWRASAVAANLSRRLLALKCRIDKEVELGVAG